MDSIRIGEGVRWVCMTNVSDGKMKLEGYKRLIEVSKEMGWTS